MARLRAEIDELGAQLATLRGEDDELVSSLATLADEERRAPDEQPVLRAMSAFLQLRGQADRAERENVRLSRALARLESARDQARALFAGFAAEHAFPLEGLDDVGRALDDFRAGARELDNALRLLGVQGKAHASAESRRTRATARQATALRAQDAAADQERTARVRAAEAHAALGRDHATQLDRRRSLEADIDRTKRTVEDTNGRLTDLKIRAADAKGVLASHEVARMQAGRVRDDALAAWWEAVDAGLTRYLGIADPDRRVVETALDGARAARRELTTATVPGRADEERAWRRCVERLQDLRQELLPSRDARTSEPSDFGSGPDADTAADAADAAEAAAASGDEHGDSDSGEGGPAAVAVARYERTIIMVEILAGEASGWLSPPTRRTRCTPRSWPSGNASTPSRSRYWLGCLARRSSSI